MAIRKPIIGATGQTMLDSSRNQPQVRINPLYFPSESATSEDLHVLDVPITISSSTNRTSPKSRFRVSTLVIGSGLDHNISCSIFEFLIVSKVDFF